MEAKLSILIDSALGRIGSMNIIPGRTPNTVNIQKRYRAHTKASEHLACKVFTLADLVYHKMTDCQKNVWRVAAMWHKISGYDLWMSHAMKNMNVGIYPPAIPPTPGGWRHGYVPGGPYYFESEDVPFLPKQTCYGSIKVETTIVPGDPVFGDITVDLDHPDDDDAFWVEIWYWVLWNQTARQWWLTGHVPLMRSHEVHRIWRPSPPPDFDFELTCVIEIVYGNLRQRYQTDVGDRVGIPQPYCTATVPKLAMANTQNPWVPPLEALHMHPVDSLCSLNIALDHIPQSPTGPYTLINPNLTFTDLSGASDFIANYHLYGLWVEADRQFKLHYNGLKKKWSQAPSRFPPGLTYRPSARFINVYDGKIFALDAPVNELVMFQMTTPPSEPIQP